MEDKYLSIITNFGCHYKCSYCIVKKNGIQVPRTTLEGLDNLKTEIKNTGANIISVSGGGDPLYHLVDHMDWYQKLFNICDQMHLPLEIHTSYTTKRIIFPFYKCARVVYHVHSLKELDEIYRTGNEIIRVVFVVTKDFTEEYINQIVDFVKISYDIDELSFRQMVDENYETRYYCHEYLKAGHKKDWWYIEQNDYNTYYVEGKIYHRFEDMKGAN